jgi:hypothetical protein
MITYLQKAETKSLPRTINHKLQIDRPGPSPLLRGIWLFLPALMLVGCGTSQPAIAKANVKLVEKLHAAVVNKNADWLQTTSKQIEAARRQGKLSDQEFAALDPIVADGRQGNWDDANARLQALITAQHGR